MSVGFVPSLVQTAQVVADLVAFWDGYSTFANGVINGAAEGPLYAPELCDNVWLDGKRLPGVCKAHGQPTLGIDKKASKGRDGVVFTVNGYVPGPIEIESKIWTPEQWAKWQEIIPSIWRRPNAGSVKGSTLAISIAYWAFAFAGISQVVIVGMAPPEKGDIPQSMIIKFKALEFVPPGAVNDKTVTPRPPRHPPNDAGIPTLNAPSAPSKGGNGLAGAGGSKLGGAT